VSETSTANFLLVEQGTLVSPRLVNSLAGVSRRTVIELAGRLSIPFVERDITAHQAVSADEALLASTPYCLMPVARINGVAVGAGAPGPVFRRLIDAWSQEVGLDIVQQIVQGARRRQANNLQRGGQEG
jgi:branched-chain amino acid aminotransferase